MQNPRLLSVTLTDTDTNYRLYDLLAAVEPEFSSLNMATQSLQGLRIQMDIDEGATRLFIGNSDISGTNYGRCIVATQVAAYDSWQGYSITLGDIYVRANAATTLIHVEVIQ